MTEPLLRVKDLVKRFPVTGGLLKRVVAHVHAVDGVSFELAAGETLGLVGESGCGKSTTGRCILRLIEPTSGEVWFEGRDVAALGRAELAALRRDMQIIFQDPYASLNPRLTVGQLLGEPMLVHGVCAPAEVGDRSIALLAQVGLPAESMGRYPHQFSGGQRQRLGIARALGLGPRLLVCDEPVSALDVSVQAQVINLLRDLQTAQNLAYLFIAHDLAVVAHLCRRVAVMYLGEIVELGPVDAVLASPLHPYTQALMSAVPGSGRSRIILPGDPPSPLEPSSAERFTRRFPGHAAAFTDGPIRLQEAEPGHWVRCARLDVLRGLAAIPA